MFTLLLAFCTLAGEVYAQSSAESEDDPLVGSYILSKNADAVVLKTGSDYNGYFNMKYFTFNQELDITNTGLRTGNDNPKTDENWSVMDAISGSFNNDGKEELVVSEYAEVNGEDGVRLCLYTIDESGFNLISSTETWPIADKKQLQRVRLKQADLTNNGINEVVMAYLDKDDYIRLLVFEVNEELELIKHSEAAIKAHNVETWPGTYGNNYYEYHQVGDGFDICCGDFDGNDTKEVVLVHGLDFKCDRLEDPRLNTDQKIKFRIAVLGIVTDDLIVLKEDKDVEFSSKYNVDNGDDVPAEYEGEMYRLSRPSLSVLKNGAGRDYFVLGFIASRRFKASIYRTLKSLVTIKAWQLNEVSEVQEIIDNSPFHMVDFWAISNPNQGLDRNFREHFTHHVECKDLNNDGVDEVICSGFTDIVILDYNNLSDTFVERDRVPFNNNNAYESHPKSFSVEDVNTILGNTEKEIVYLNYSKSTYHHEPTSTNLAHLGAINLCACTIKVDTNGEITVSETSSVEELVESASTSSNRFYQQVICTDVKGNGLRLGKPVLGVAESLIKPIVILKAPPAHFDIINGQTYDLCGQYQVGNDDVFQAVYEKADNVTYNLSTKAEIGFSLEAFIKAEVEAAGNEAKAKLTQRRKLQLEAEYGLTNEFSKAYKLPITDRDKYIVLKHGYKFFEYPLFLGNEQVTSILLTIPTNAELIEYDENNDLSNSMYVSYTEVGNALSYNRNVNLIDRQCYSDINHKVDDAVLVGDNEQIFSFKTMHNAGLSLMNSYTISGESEFSAGFDAEMFGVKTKATAGGGISTNFDLSSTNTFKTTLSQETSFTVRYGYIQEDSNGELYNYWIKPYVYWSNEGAIVLDYFVDPVVNSDVGFDTWWDKTYGQEVDLAFALPYRFAPEKGIEIGPEYRRYLTKEIVCDKDIVQVGDELKVKMRLHNFSLKDIKAEQILVHLFIGDPDNNGILIHEHQELFSMPARGMDVCNMTFTIPQGTPEGEQFLYAIIDPNNSINEIHEGNNKGYTGIIISRAVDIDDVKDLNNEQNKINPLTIKPNPLRSQAYFDFNLKVPAQVQIDIYNLTGQKVACAIQEQLKEGKHEIGFDASGLKSGLYLVVLKIAEDEYVNKFVKL